MFNFCRIFLTQTYQNDTPKLLLDIPLSNEALFIYFGWLQDLLWGIHFPYPYFWKILKNAEK